VVDAPQPHEACYLKLDCSKARALLGWRPAIGLETALEWTIAWYRAHLDGEDMRGFGEAQLERYEAAVAALPLEFAPERNDV
jgi:CDP-glucose 4,6-dehydratase